MFENTCRTESIEHDASIAAAAVYERKPLMCVCVYVVFNNINNKLIVASSSRSNLRCKINDNDQHSQILATDKVNVSEMTNSIGQERANYKTMHTP